MHLTGLNLLHPYALSCLLSVNPEYKPGVIPEVTLAGVAQNQNKIL